MQDIIQYQHACSVFVVIEPHRLYICNLHSRRALRRQSVFYLDYPDTIQYRTRPACGLSFAKSFCGITKVLWIFHIANFCQFGNNSMHGERRMERLRFLSNAGVDYWTRGNTLRALLLSDILSTYYSKSLSTPT
jgi:hypothetical protein